MLSKRFRSLCLSLTTMLYLNSVAATPVYETYIESWNSNVANDVTGYTQGYSNVIVDIAFADFNFSSYTPGDLPSGVQFADGVNELKTVAEHIQSNSGKVKLSFGGATYPITSSPSWPNASTMATNIASVINNPPTGFTWDGADFDLESGPPAGMTPQAYAETLLQFFQDLRTACPNKILSLTIPGQGWGQWIEILTKLLGEQNPCPVNYINFMEYDIWTGVSYPLEQIKGDIVTYTSATTDTPPPNGAAGWGLSPSLIQLGLMPGCDDQSHFLSVADTQTLTAYAVSKGLYGVMTWDLDRDVGPTSLPSCSSYPSHYEYSNAIRAALTQTVPSPKTLSSVYPQSIRQVTLRPFIRQPPPPHGAPD